MRILIHMGDPYPDECPCAKRMRTFYEEMVKKGHTVTVLAPLTEQSHINTKDVIYCPTIKMKKKTTIYRLLNSLVFAFFSLVKSFKVGKIDVVITTSPPPLISMFGWLIAKIKHAKLVYDVRDIWPDVAWEMGSFDKNSFYSKVFEFIRNFMLKHADLVTAVSPGKVKKLKEYNPKCEVIEITNGLDEQFLKNEDYQAVAEQFRIDEKFSCVYIGNLGLAQGLKQLLKIAKKAKEEKLEVQFLLFGSGAEETLLKEFVKENHLDNVIFPGRLPNKEMYTVLKHADMSFISLVNENLKDSIPTKMYEALGAGCPVLLAAVGDSVDVLNDCKLGVAVQPNDEEALWNAFYKMYQTLPDILLYKEHAIKTIIEKYSRQKAAMKMEKALKKLC